MKCDKFVLRYGRLLSLVVLDRDRPTGNVKNVLAILPGELVGVILGMLPVKDRFSFACVSQVISHHTISPLMHTIRLHKKLHFKPWPWSINVH